MGNQPTGCCQCEVLDCLKRGVHRSETTTDADWERANDTSMRESELEADAGKLKLSRTLNV